MLRPKPTQIEGARFLASRRTALLADLPRVGKTGAAIMAADMVLAQRILVITTASGRPVWQRGFADWSDFGRRLQMLDGDKLDPKADVVIASWGALTQPETRGALWKREWDLLILDEAHAAKNFETKRTQAVYGTLVDGRLLVNGALETKALRTWALTGTPIPNCPLDVYPMMRALCPDRLDADPSLGWPDVRDQDAFTTRYAKMRPMKVSRSPWGKVVQVFVEGRNLDELKARLDGFYIQRTQQDVGILEPEYEIMPVTVEDAARRTLEFNVATVDTARLLAAAEAGDTRSLDMHMGPLRRITGTVKAAAIVELIQDEMKAGLDKIVLAYWHTAVGAILHQGLIGEGVVGIDGSATAKQRGAAEKAFRENPRKKVFLAQIQAAGEAIDLSAASQMIFVESSFVPKDMLQMALRICNHTQKQRPLVRVAALEGSIDEGLQKVLTRKWTAINQVLA